MKAIRVHETGEPKKLRYEDITIPEPAEGQVRIKIEAAGLNYIDVNQRAGVYPVTLPLIPGQEAAGTIDAIGPGVTRFSIGDRVAYPLALGAYAEYASVPAWQVVHLPDKIDTQVAAAVMLQGLTAHYLACSTYPLQSRDVALIHAAAGGVGLLLVQIAKMRGARVIGTVSTEEKAQLAVEAGADEIILYTEVDFETETRRLTDNTGVNVVYDAVGLTTFDKSLNCLTERGMMVLYGQASGRVPSFDLRRLGQSGSLFITRPSLGDYARDTGELTSRTDDLFQWIEAETLSVRIDRTYSLADAAQAHQYMQDRKTKGKVLLIP
jgi:NADPH2:quinone reductase